MVLTQFEIVYQQIKAAARAQIARHAAQTMSTTDLVHEAYLKLAAFSPVDAPESAALPGIDTVRLFAHAMRQILIDAARRRQSVKRGENPLRVALSDELATDQDDTIDVIALNQAIAQIKQHSERMGLVVELHFFAGLPFAEIAALLAVDRRTILRDWTAARFEIARLLGVELTPGALQNADE